MSEATLTLQLAELVVLQARPRLGGLCRDCRLAETCTFPRHPSRPVRSCEEFDPVQEILAPIPAVRGSRPMPAPPEEQVIGLCRECARQSTCRYPKPPGGVWHCNELA